MSKIRAVEAIPLRYPVAGPAYGSSRGVVSHRESTLVKVRLESGVVGLGETFGPPQVMCRLVEETEEALVGLSVDEALPTLVRFSNAMYHRGTGLSTAAVSGVDAAVWDALARTAGMSLAGLLGGRARSTVVPYASAGYVIPGQDLSGFRSRLEEDVAGFTAAKIKIGVGLSDDVERVQLARDVLGSDRELMVDVNGNYTADEAQSLCRELVDVRVAWLEEPLAPEDVSGLASLRQHGVTLATGESLFTRHPFRPLLVRRLVDVIQPDVTKVGGVSEMRALVEMARAWSIRVSPHVWGGGIALATSLQILANIPDYPHAAHVTSTPWLEFDRAENGLRDHLLTTPIVMKGGLVEVPNGTGIGVELDEDYVNHTRMDG
jgi:D-galactarolactone cycloisomerase